MTAPEHDAAWTAQIALTGRRLDVGGRAAVRGELAALRTELTDATRGLAPYRGGLEAEAAGALTDLVAALAAAERDAAPDLEALHARMVETAAVLATFTGADPTPVPGKADPCA